jgi:hypothetical protein
MREGEPRIIHGDFKTILTVDGRPPVTINELKIASLSPMVRSYVNTGILLERHRDNPGEVGQLRERQVILLDFMQDPEILELSAFRTWEGQQEILNRWGDPHDIA